MKKNLYVSLLRGINVSGKRLIKMEALRRCYESIGFEKVTSHLQSGNLIFYAEEQEVTKLSQKISSRIEAEFGHEVPVMVLTAQEFRNIAESNPFTRHIDKDPSFFHITFLSANPENYDTQAIMEKKQKGEEVAITDRAVYLYCPNGYGKTKLTNNLFENKLNLKATTRNQKTVDRLLELLEPPKTQQH
ncbi:DUF1697 domain-containing protein [Robertkochia marina]|uniref:DUF1697 domain-containing protein n=1 Tax=Robertkochia marina TaxID=1227945 RepID=A0A4S3LZ00_9FLAO|nr:DUF1697 domain-containing protein [Robertkochia marina]THD66515.1 DUF1697 domain-containing protein [Robertkochia marina]TRZ45644.1 DUF1697 domain-containing protein [Robertkochia marina]